VILATRSAAALEKVKVGIPATEAFSFMPVDFRRLARYLSAQRRYDREGRSPRQRLPASAIVGDFLTHAIFATDKIVRDNPNAVRALLRGWFETIAHERAHRDKTIAYAVTAVRRSAAVEAQEYDTVMPMYLADGKFPASGLEVVRQSFVEMNILDSAPDLTKYYAEELLPNAK
jgi:hypothetical protein